MARLGASIATEVTSGLGQQHVSIHYIATVAKLARIRVKSAKKQFTWIGMAGRWIYLREEDIPEESCELTEQTVAGTNA